MKLYKVPESKIKVIYEGINQVLDKNTTNLNQAISLEVEKPYLLFIGRLEERKNVRGIVEAFDILKERYKINHRLVLAGKPGYGYESSKLKTQSSKFKDDILEVGYISEEEKWKLLKNADVFLFPTFYEGFGLPILEAQSVGVPVVASDNSSIPELIEVQPRIENRDSASNRSAILINPNNPSEIAEAAYELISDKVLRNNMINRGYENVKRFSWDKCAEKITKILKN